MVRCGLLTRREKLWNHYSPCQTYIKWVASTIPGKKMAVMGKEKFVLLQKVPGMIPTIASCICRC